MGEAKKEKKEHREKTVKPKGTQQGAAFWSSEL